MSSLPEYLAVLRDFFESGGYVLWAIFAVSLVLWALIVERYVYLRLVYPKDLQMQLEVWRGRSDQRSWFAQKIRDALVFELATRLSRFLALVKSLIAVCPLLGLLGTVTGMIHVFDVMAVLGTTNPRAMATGISMATIPTMAGLVVALSGLFFSGRLRQQTAMERQRVFDLLREAQGETA
jgi:biopolymer transport protein ExbB